jgi:hypothetical protein
MSEETAKTAPSAKAEGVGSFIRQEILAGKGNKEILAEVRAKFPESKMTAGGVGWYRNKLKKQGKGVKDSRQIEPPAPKAEKPAKEAKPKGEKKAGRAAASAAAAANDDGLA